MRATRRRASGWAALAEVVTGGAEPEVTAAATAPYLPVTEIQSPMAPDPSTIFNTLVWQDLLGTDAATPMTRATAMALPAVARARHLLCGTIGRLPLTVWTGDVRLEGDALPTWTYRTDYGYPPFHRLLWTVDDLIFSGWSLWARQNTAPSEGGRPRAMTRIPPERWRFTAAATIEVRQADGRWEVARQDEVTLIPGPHEGIINFGAQAIREAAGLAKAAGDAAANPAAYIDLHYTGDEPLTEPQIDALVARWVAARKGANGGVAFTNKYVEAKEMGTHEAHLLTEGRNAAAVDMARLVGIPAAMIDATNAGASLTYETTAGRNAEFLDYGGNLYMDAITARLSMDDVVARGQSVRFDTSELRTPAPSPTGPTTED